MIARRRLEAFLLPWIGPVLLLALWQVAATADWGGFRPLPLPRATLSRAGELLATRSFQSDVAATLGRWSAGFSLAVLIGAPIGVAVGMNARLDSSSRVLLDFFRSLPVTAAFPIFLVVLGVGDAAMIAMILFATVFIVMLHARYGVMSTPDSRVAMAKSFGATPLQIFVRIRLIEAAGHVFIGARTVLSLSLIVAIVSEMFIGASHGLGQRLYLAYQLQSLEELYALVLLVGVLGYAANWVFVAFERRFEF